MMPIVNGLEAEFEGEVAVTRLNALAAQNAGIVERYQVRSHPTFVVLDGVGEETNRYFGPQETETLRAALEGVVPADGQ